MLPLTCWLHFCYCIPVCVDPPSLQRCCCLFSACYLPEPPSLFQPSCLLDSHPQPILVDGVVPSQMQDSAFAEFHEVPVSTFPQPVEVPRLAHQLHHPPILVPSASLLRVPSVLLSSSLMIVLKTISPSPDPQGTPLITVYQSDFRSPTTTS